MILIFAVLGIILTLRLAKASRPRLNVPIVGSTSLLGWVGAVKSLFYLRDYVLEGYFKYHGRPFQVATLRGWEVFVGGKYVEELRSAPDDVLSGAEEIDEFLNWRYTLGESVVNNPYHVGVVRKALVQNLSEVVPAVSEEIAQAFGDNLPHISTHSWTAVGPSDLMARIIARATSRMIIGLPLCRNEEYLELVTSFTLTAVVTGLTLCWSPSFLRPLVRRLFKAIPAAKKRFAEFIVPIVVHRQQLAAGHSGAFTGDADAKDLLQWLIESAEGEEQSPALLSQRAVALVFASMHTSSMAATQALLYLSGHPEYVTPLREEVKGAIEEHGWSKQAFDSTVMLDSFLKETQRLSSIGVSSIIRKVLRPFTFSDGTILPPDTHVLVNAYAISRDPVIYPSPETFDPFRFYRLAQQDNNPTRHLVTTPSPHFLAFGLGAHACPGRAFAAQEVKAILAYILLNYDVRMELGVRPADRYILHTCIPGPGDTVLFRKRLHEELAKL